MIVNGFFYTDELHSATSSRSAGTRHGNQYAAQVQCVAKRCYFCEQIVNNIL